MYAIDVVVDVSTGRCDVDFQCTVSLHVKSIALVFSASDCVTIRRCVETIAMMCAHIVASFYSVTHRGPQEKPF